MIYFAEQNRELSTFTWGHIKTDIKMYFHTGLTSLKLNVMVHVFDKSIFYYYYATFQVLYYTHCQRTALNKKPNFLLPFQIVS